MSERSEHRPNTPGWVDVTLGGNPDDGIKFYCELFGWEVTDRAGGPETTGGYRFFSYNGKEVAGHMPLPEESPRPSWTTYVIVADAAETVAKAKSAGGTVMAEPMQVHEAGSIAILVDPVGAVLGLWQPGDMKGAELVDEPGSFCWNELNTREPAKAAPFYESVFDWDGETRPASSASAANYTTWTRDGQMAAGMIEMNDQWPAEAPAQWMTYFAVEDADESASGCEQLGGQIHVPPFDITEIGRAAVLGAPDGALFSVIRLDNPQ